MDLDRISPQEISRKLEGCSNKPIDYPYPSPPLEDRTRPAAVLIPLVRDNKEWKILFIRRTEIQGDRHSGQVAFPGGVCNSNDSSAEEAAKRETHEELGIQANDITILGKLNQFLTVTNFIVTPIVGMIPWPYPLHLEPKEVSRAFTIPLTWLNNSSNWKVIPYELSNGKTTEVIYFKQYDGEILWGASARFVLTFFNALSSK
ncbi:MAG: CoA pyrophosphatase [Anaerolineales bacterium]|jgi:8-oxo-dGTP pyrophosphatase MutT (NUDIX family)